MLFARGKGSNGSCDIFNRLGTIRPSTAFWFFAKSHAGAAIETVIFIGRQRWMKPATAMPTWNCLSTAGNGGGACGLVTMSSAEIAKPLARAINIYRRVARHDLDARMRRDLARHIKQLVERGVRDPSRLTVHGLSYLRSRDRSGESR